MRKAPAKLLTKDLEKERSKRECLRFRSVVLLLACSLGCSLSCAQTNHLYDAAAVNADRTIHVVIENPAGSDEKWEVRANGALVREQMPSGPVSIPYLPWPVNGGMIPRTLLSAALGGDGEPVDVLVLGPALERGALVRAQPIGLLRMIDRLERDDKVLAVLPGGPMSDVRDVEELESRYPGVREILAHWYQHSRPGGAIEVQGYGSRAAANRLIAEGVRAFEDAVQNQTMPDWITR